MYIRFWILAAITCGWFFWMTWLSHQNGEQTGKTSRELALCLEKTLPFMRMDLGQLNHLLRKAAHPVVFGGLAFWMGLTVDAAPVALPYWPFFAATALWAWADERTKLQIPGRHFSWGDVGLNLVGTLVGAGVILLLTK